MSRSSRPRMANIGVYVTQHLPLLVGLCERQTLVVSLSVIPPTQEKGLFIG